MYAAHLYDMTIWQPKRFIHIHVNLQWFQHNEYNIPMYVSFPFNKFNSSSIGRKFDAAVPLWSVNFSIRSVNITTLVTESWKKKRAEILLKQINS